MPNGIIGAGKKGRWKEKDVPSPNDSLMRRRAMHIEIAPETEAKPAAQAAAKGISLPEYLRRLLEREAAPLAPQDLSAAARTTYWRESTKGLPKTAPLSDQAISRESIYGNQPV